MSIATNRTYSTSSPSRSSSVSSATSSSSYAFATPSPRHTSAPSPRSLRHSPSSSQQHTAPVLQTPHSQGLGFPPLNLDESNGGIGESKERTRGYKFAKLCMKLLTCLCACVRRTKLRKVCLSLIPVALNSVEELASELLDRAMLALSQHAVVPVLLTEFAHSVSSRMTSNTPTVYPVYRSSHPLSSSSSSLSLSGSATQFGQFDSTSARRHPGTRGSDQSGVGRTTDPRTGSYSHHLHAHTNP